MRATAATSFSAMGSAQAGPRAQSPRRAGAPGVQDGEASGVKAATAATRRAAQPLGPPARGRPALTLRSAAPPHRTMLQATASPQARRAAVEFRLNPQQPPSPRRRSEVGRQYACAALPASGVLPCGSHLLREERVTNVCCATYAAISPTERSPNAQGASHRHPKSGKKTLQLQCGVRSRHAFIPHSSTR